MNNKTKLKFFTIGLVAATALPVMADYAEHYTDSTQLRAGELYPLPILNFAANTSDSFVKGTITCSTASTQGASVAVWENMFLNTRAAVVVYLSNATATTNDVPIPVNAGISLPIRNINQVFCISGSASKTIHYVGRQ